MYGRGDLLRSKFSLDNSLFTNELKELGFVLPEQATSNYPGTMLSLASTLNTEYVTEVIDPRFTKQSFELTQLLQKNRMRGFLENQGYEVYAFETGYRWTEWRDADHYFSLKDARMTDFEELLLRNSMLEVFIKKGYLASLRLSGAERKYELIRKTLDDLEWISGQPDTKFVYAHITIPHPPFVFDYRGEYSLIPIHVEGKDVFYTRDEYQKGYTEQIKFINRRILSIIKAILQNSSNPPVIILQGDHGPRYVSEQEQLMILSAYFLPGLNQPLDEDITPVNNFRVVLRQYFGLEIPLLANHAYFTDEAQPAGVRPITVTDP
jgi:hypothetical protein